MKWYDDIRDELVIAGLIALGVFGMWKGMNEIAATAVGGMCAWLTKSPKNNGNDNQTPKV